MAERRPIGKKIRFEVFKRDKFTCQYCGRKAPDVVLEVDHIKPVFEGGTNEMINLITACFDCNRGKGKRELSDDAVVITQQKQLEELSEKREQMEMLIAWKKELINLDALAVDSICDHFSELVENSGTINEHGKTTVKKWLKDFSLEEILDAMEISVNKYYVAENMQSVEEAFSKVGGICSIRKRQKSDPQLYYFNYAKKSLKTNFSYVNIPVLHEYIYENVFTEEDFERVRKVIKNSRNWTVFSRKFEEEFGINEC